jgi:heterotetrameric sarcosine oxidase gamma subunit
MTGISPLQSIHKKGLFGDHHKKNESDLLNIYESKNLNIVQIFHYKNSKVKKDEISIESLELPSNSPQVTSNKDTRILWSSPNTWIVLSTKEDIIKIIKEKCDDKNFAVTDISHSRAVIGIKGFNAKEVLKKGCPLNFNEFIKNNCAGTVFNGINIIIDCVDDKLQIFNIIALRSFGESLYHHITDASLEFGYVGV